MVIKKLKWSTTCPAGTCIFPNRVGGPQTRNWQLHGHDFYECFVVEDGSGFHLFHEQSASPLITGLIYFVHPDLIHGFRSANQGNLTMTNVAIQASMVERFHAYHPMSPTVWQAEAPIATVSVSKARIQEFLRLANDISNSEREELDAIYFLSGLSRLIRPTHTEPLSSDIPDWLRHALSQCSSPEHLQRGVKGLSKLCGRSPEHVSRCCRKHLGQTPIQWITKTRLAYARQLLEFTQLQILEIAMECGFENPSHFHKLFKSQYGDTPLQFRKKVLRLQSG